LYKNAHMFLGGAVVHRFLHIVFGWRSGLPLR
jgi:hypothetical protein